jgi:hypothetical protein
MNRELKQEGKKNGVRATLVTRGAVAATSWQSPGTAERLWSPVVGEGNRGAMWMCLGRGWLHAEEENGEKGGSGNGHRFLTVAVAWSNGGGGGPGQHDTARRWGRVLTVRHMGEEEPGPRKDPGAAAPGRAVALGHRMGMCPRTGEAAPLTCGTNNSVRHLNPFKLVNSIQMNLNLNQTNQNSFDQNRTSPTWKI